MAHPLKHAESSARKFGGKAEDYLPIHNWLTNRKHCSRTFATGHFAIMRRAFSWPRSCLELPL